MKTIAVFFSEVAVDVDEKYLEAGRIAARVVLIEYESMRNRITNHRQVQRTIEDNLVDSVTVKLSPRFV